MTVVTRLENMLPLPRDLWTPHECTFSMGVEGGRGGATLNLHACRRSGSDFHVVPLRGIETRPIAIQPRDFRWPCCAVALTLA